jgi:SPX domain protein involved in polyphosphate accumulation
MFLKIKGKRKNKGVKRHFQRYELKYHIKNEERELILKNIQNFIVKDPYNKTFLSEDIPGYFVNSLYFDTKHRDFYFQKLDGIEKRKKYRIRVYEEFHESKKFFLEIKRKNNDITYKDRTVLNQKDFLDLMGNDDHFYELEKKAQEDKEVLEELYFDKYMMHLEPAVRVAYFREAYFWEASEEVRLTFDHNIQYYHTKNLLNKKQVSFDGWSDDIVFEIKIKGYMPFWLSNIVKRLNLEAHAFSKYCNGIDELEKMI